MITFEHLSLQNFRSWKRLEVPLTDRGVVCVQGDTGAGKSSIFAGLYWGLFGTLPDAVRVDEVRRDKAKKSTAVRLRLSKDGQVYHIVRFRESKTYKNKVLFTGHGIPTVVEDSHVKTVQGLINQFLGVTPQQFLATTYFAQRNFHFFHTLTDQGKKIFIESLTYGSLFEACEAETRQRVRLGEQTVAHLQGQMQGLEASIRALDSQSKEALAALTEQEKELTEKLASVERFLETSQVVMEGMWPDVERFNMVNAMVNETEEERLQTLDDLKRLETNQKPCPRCGLIMPENLVAERMHALSEEYKKLTKLLERGIAQRERLLPKSLAYEERQEQVNAQELEAERLRVELQSLKREQKRVAVPPGLEEELIALRKELAKHQRTLAYTSFWIKGFGFQGLRAFVLQNAIHYLSSQVERYLRRIMGERIEFAMLLENTRLLTECNGRSYGSLSGGEKQAVDLATGLAMRDLASRYAKSQFNLLVLDEPHEGLDKHLTAVAQDLLLDYEMPSTFLITHQDYSGHFDQLCTVMKKDGESRMRLLY